MPLDIRLVAYEPFGARIGELPQPLSIDSADPLSDTPSLQLEYAESSVGAQSLTRPIEIAREVYDPGTKTWVEPVNGRFMLIRTEGDRLDATGNMRYIAPGYSWILNKVQVYPTSKEVIDGRIQDASATEKSKRSTLNAKEDQLADILLKRRDVPVEYGTSAPSNQEAIWVNTSNWDSRKSAVPYIYRNNQWVEVWDGLDSNSRTTGQALATEAYPLWIAHQESQGQLRDVQSQSKLTKRTFIGKHAGAVFAELIAEARARGDRLPGLVTNFTTSVDSAGSNWPATNGTIEVNTGTSLLRLMQTFVSTGQLDFRTNGRELQVYTQDTAMNRDVSGSITLRYGLNIDEAPDRATWENLASDILFLGDEGLNYTKNNPEAPQPWGRWESTISQGGVDSEATGSLLASNALKESSGQRVERTRALVFRDDVTHPLPYVHYRPGDMVMAPNSSRVLEPQRIEQITLSKTSDGLVAGNIVLHDRFLEREIKNQRTTEALVGGGTVGGPNGTRNPETYVDLRTPEAPKHLQLDAATQAQETGGYQSVISMSWWWSRMATNGTSMEGGVDHFEPQYRLHSEGSSSNEGIAFTWRSLPKVDGASWATEFGPLPTYHPWGRMPATYDVRVRAFGTNGKVSDWSVIESIKMPLDDTAPEPPSRPGAKVEGSLIRVLWNGQNNIGGFPPVDFRCIRIEQALVPPDAPYDVNDQLTDDYLNALSWEPADGDLITEAGGGIVQGLPYKETYTFRLIAVDHTGNESEPSAPSNVEATVPLVDTDAMDAELAAAREVQQTEMQALQGELDTAEGLITSNKAAQDQLKLDLEAADQALSGRHDELAGNLSTAVSTLEAADETIRGDLSALDSELGTAQGELATAQSNLSSLSARTTTAEGKISTAEGKITTAEGKITTAEDGIATLKTNLGRAISAAAAFGDFEADDINLGSHPDFTIKHDAALSRSGARYGETWARSDRAAWLYMPAIPVVAGRQYRVSFWMWHDQDVTGSAGFPAMWWMEDGSSHNSGWPPVYTRAQRTNQVVGAWYKVEGLVTPPAGAVAMRPRFYVWQGSAPDGTIIRFDDLAVVDVDDAQMALTSASGKNKVTYAVDTLGAPATADRRAGDIHWVVSGTSPFNVIEQWRYNGAIWHKASLDSQVIANLDVGKLTAGTAEMVTATAQKIAAGVGQFVEVEAENVKVTGELSTRIANVMDLSSRNLIVTGNTTLDGDTWAKNLAAEQISASTIDAGQLRVTGTSTLDSAVVNRLFADIFSANKITTKELLVGGGSNLHPDPEFTNPYIWNTHYLAALGTGKSGGTTGSILITPNAYQRGGYMNLGEDKYFIPVISGEKYRISVWVRTDRTAAAESLALYARAYSSTQLSESLVFTSPANVSNESAISANIWTQISGIVEVPEGRDQLCLGVFAQSSYEGAVRFSEIAVQQAVGSTLISDGAVTTEKITVTGDLSAKIVDAMDLTAKKLVVTDETILNNATVVNGLAADVVKASTIGTDQLVATTAAIDSAVVDKIWAQKIAAQKIHASEVVIGNGFNMLPNGYGEYGDNSGMPSNYTYATGDPGFLAGTSSKGWFHTTAHFSTVYGSFPVQQGKSYRVSMKVRGDVDTQRTYLDVTWHDIAGTYLGFSRFASNVPINTTWQTFTSTFSPIANAVEARIRSYNVHPNSTGTVQGTTRVHYADIEFQERVDSSLIVDGSILAKHIKGLEIEAGHLKANTITGDKLNVADVRATIVTSDAFKGKTYESTGGKFYGGSFQTHLSADRGVAVLGGDLGGLRITNVSGTRVFDVSTQTGDVMVRGMISAPQGEPGLKIVNAESSYNADDMGLWFTRDGKAYGWGAITSGPKAAGGVFQTNVVSAGVENIDLQIRPTGIAEVRIWEGLRFSEKYSTSNTFFIKQDTTTKWQGSNDIYLIPGGRIYLGAAGSSGNGVFLGQGFGYPYANTAGANVHVDSSGLLWKTTSRSDRKLDQREYQVPETILDLPVKDWIDRSAHEMAQKMREDQSFPLSEVDQKHYDTLMNMANRRIPGVIAEEAAQCGADALVQYDENGEITGFDYSKLSVFLLPFLKELWADYKTRTTN